MNTKILMCRPKIIKRQECDLASGKIRLFDFTVAVYQVTALHTIVKPNECVIWKV